MCKRKGFTLIELLVVVSIIGLLVALLMPSLSRALQQSRRAMSLANLSGIYKSCLTAANDTGGLMPGAANSTANYGVPRKSASTGVKISNEIGGKTGVSRDKATTSNDDASPTRALWTLVKAGMAAPKQFINPNTSASTDDTTNVTQYFDFYSGDNVTYGYQCPFGNGAAAPNQSGLDVQTVLCADRGPYFLDPGTLYNGNSGERTTITAPTSLERDTVIANTPSGKLRADFKTGQGVTGASSSTGSNGSLNSPNERGEGVGFISMGGGAKFEDNPCVGKGLDNIYTCINSTQVDYSAATYDGKTSMNGAIQETVGSNNPTQPSPLNNADSYIVP